MRILTVHQPWATLLARGEYKTIETRSWSTSYRGPVAIHAGATWRPWQRSLCMTEPIATALRIAPPDLERHRPGKAPGMITERIGLALGAVVGVAELVDVRTTSRPGRFGHVPEPWVLDLDPVEAMMGDYSLCRFGWFFEGFRPLDAPIRAQGRQGLQSPNPVILAKVEAALALIS